MRQAQDVANSTGCLRGCLEPDRCTHQGYLPERAQHRGGQAAHGRERGELAFGENVLLTLKVLLIKQDPAGEGKERGDVSGWIFEPALS